VAAFEFSSGSGFDNLVVANNGDGTFALLVGGPHGLNLTGTATEPGLPNPTGLAFLAFTGVQVRFYAATEGSEAATLLTFQLGRRKPLISNVPVLQKVLDTPAASFNHDIDTPAASFNHDRALPLIATLLILTIETSSAEFDPGAFDGEAAAAVSFLTVGQSLTVSTVTVGQSLTVSLPEHASTGESENGDAEEPNKPKEPDLPVT